MGIRTTNKTLDPATIAQFVGHYDTGGGVMSVARFSRSGVLGAIESRVTAVEATLSGAIGGTVVDINGPHTVDSTDAGKVLNMAAAGCYTLTFGAAGGYASNHSNVITNPSSSRAKIISLDGVLSFLWPRQVCLIFKLSSSGWIRTQPERFRPLTFAAQLYVDYDVGLDTNDGFAAGSTNALKTIAEGVSRFEKYMDCATDLQLSGTTHPVGSGVAVTKPAFGTTNQLSITGNVGSRASYIISCDAGGTAINVQDGAILTLKGVHVRTTGNGSTGVLSRQGAVCDLDSVDFDAFPLGNHMDCRTWSSLNVLGNYAIKGSAVSHLIANFNSYVNYGAAQGGGALQVDIPSALAFTLFLSAGFNANINNGGVPPAFIGAGYAGTTGQLYQVFNSANATVGATLPGNSAGATSLGGNYA